MARGPADGGAMDRAVDVATRSDSGGMVAAILSLIALAVSGVSLWETVLRQSEMTLFVGDTLSYTRDPWGSHELFVVPLTISNGGAQDGAVLKLILDVRNEANGQSERYESAYVVDATYFAGRDDVSARLRKPKVPFAPIAVAGRGAFTGTVLFYPPEFREQKLIEPRAKFTATLTAVMPPATGWLERTLARRPDPVAMRLEAPNFLVGALLSGDLARLKLGETRKP